MLNDKIVELLEQLSTEMGRAGYAYGMAIISAGGQLHYSGNIPSVDGARLMRGWLEAETDSCVDVDLRRANDVCDMMAN